MTGTTSNCALFLWRMLSRNAHVFTSLVTSAPSVETAAAAELLQSCPILCDPIDGSPPGSPIPGILQARMHESEKWKVKVKWLSRVRLFAAPWTAAHQALPSLGSPGESTGVGAITFSVCENYPNETQSGTERWYSSLAFFSSNCFFLGYSRPCAFLCEF